MPRRISLLAVRGLLALFVAWGAIREITSPLFAPFHLPVETIQRLYPKTKYTWMMWKYMQRGWPLVFAVRTNVPEGASEIKNEDNPLALACDVAFVAIIVFASWNLFRGWRLRFAMADLLAAMTALGVTMAFQMRMWDDVLDSSIIAIDIGVYSTAMMSLRFGRKLITTLRGPAQALATSDLSVKVQLLTDEMRQMGTREESARVYTDQ
jgi:hypothetical protein